MKRSDLSRAHRVVVKIGTGVLTDRMGEFDAAAFESLASQLVHMAADRAVVVVSSGAVALGVKRLGLKRRPRDIPGKQAAAAAGQAHLINRYDEAFGRAGLAVAQVLLTHDDLAHRTRYLNARRALFALIEGGVIPVINENDTVAVEELKFGDNDALAGLVAGLVGADLLVILSDVEGLFTADPRLDPSAVLIPEVEKVTAELEKLATGSRSGLGTGGMLSKVQAAKRAGQAGAATVIALGKRAGVLDQVLSGVPVGTLIQPEAEPLKGKKHWMAHAVKSKGELRVDEGARKALLEGKSSLLPSGVREVSGRFGVGEPVDIAGPDGKAFARGLAGYSSEEIALVKGHKTTEIESILGYKYLDEVVHRDDLVLL